MIRLIIPVFFAAIIVSLMLGGSFLWDSYMISPEDGATEIAFMVNSGDTVKNVSARLKQDALIESPFWFETYVWMSKTGTSFQAGLFTLQPGMSYSVLVGELTNAQAQEVQVTFPEGYLADEMGEEIRSVLTSIQESDWQTAVSSQSTLFDAGTHVLDGIPSGQGLEGYLFPDTYRFVSNASAETIAETMVLTLKRRFAENSVIIPDDLLMGNGMTLHEVLTLASIVEKEVPDAEGMKIVADIFLKRLEVGMALQACSTVNYVTGNDDPAVTYEDQEIDSPYNTYQRVGLPPGPISNPGMNAILAVLNPTPNDYYYFLTSTEGEMMYSKTYDEHVTKKQMYLK